MVKSTDIILVFCYPCPGQQAGFSVNNTKAAEATLLPYLKNYFRSLKQITVPIQEECSSGSGSTVNSTSLTIHHHGCLEKPGAQSHGITGASVPGKLFSVEHLHVRPHKRRRFLKSVMNNLFYLRTHSAAKIPPIRWCVKGPLRVVRPCR